LLRREQLGDWRLKLYGISAHGELPREEVAEATLMVAREVLPRPGWELGVVDFEGRAWREDVLANPDGPTSPATCRES
jgi:hypothetical protein